MTTGTVGSNNLTSLYSNTTSFTTGLVNSSVYSVNGGLGVTVNPTTGNVVVSIGQDVATTANVQFANVTATGNLSNNYYTLANAAGTNGQVLTTNGAGVTTWTTPSSLGLVSSVTGSGAGISVSPTTGAVIVSNTGVTSAVAGSGIGVSAGTGAVTFSNTGVTSAVAGTGIGVNAGTGAVTITNSGVTSIVAGSNISISGGTGAVTITATGFGTGDVSGPASATDNAIARFDGTTGKLIQNSTVTIADTTGDITTPGDLTVNGGNININGTATTAVQPFLTFAAQPDGVNPLYGVRGSSTVDDPWFVGSGSVGDDLGYLEIATGDNAGGSNSGGQIYVRQYNNGATAPFGVPWEGGTGTVVNQLTLLDNLGNTVIPKNLTVDSGTLFVDATNNRVGINNTSPQYELHIDQGLDGITQFAMTTFERTTLLTMNDGDDLLSLSYGGPNRLQFDTTNQWFNTGKLGVATATPAYTLDVNGTANVETTLTVPSITTLTGDDLNITAFSGRDVTISTTLATDPVTIVRNTAATGSGGIPVRALTLRVDSTGTPVVGFGSSIDFETETTPGTTVQTGYIIHQSTGDNAGVLDEFKMSFGVMSAGTTTTRMVLDNLGNLQIDNDLTVTGTNINTGVTDTIIQIDRTSSDTAIPTRALKLLSTSTGTPAVGFGTALGFQGQTAVSTFKDAAFIAVSSTDITSSNEDFIMSFGLMQNGATYDTKMSLNSAGDLTIDGILDTIRIDIDNQATIDTATLTTTATTTVPLLTSTRNAITGLVNIIQGANVHCVNVTILRIDATTAMLTTYGEMYNTTSLASFTADVSAGSVRLLITPTSATSTVFSAVRTSLT